jgi:hypothetical protein
MNREGSVRKHHLGCSCLSSFTQCLHTIPAQTFPQDDLFGSSIYSTFRNTHSS